MRIMVFGAGALGSLVGAHLARRYRVHLVGRATHIDAIRANGLRVVGSKEFLVQPEASTEVPRHWVPEVVLIAVKSPATAEAVTVLKGAVASRTVVVTLQNGLGNWEILKEAFPANTVLAASVVYGARLVEPGVVAGTGTPALTLGGGPADLEIATTLSEAFSLAELPTMPVDDIRGPLLGKALINAVINPLTAIHRIPNGEIASTPGLARRLDALIAEGERLLRAAPYSVPLNDLRSAVLKIAETTGKNHSSMLQDVERGRRTEIEAITGKLVELGRTLGIELPENERVLGEVRAIENAYLNRAQPAT